MHLESSDTLRKCSTSMSEGFEVARRKFPPLLVAYDSAIRTKQGTSIVAGAPKAQNLVHKVPTVVGSQEDG